MKAKPRTPGEIEKSIRHWGECIVTWVWVLVASLLIWAGLPPWAMAIMAVVQIGCSISLKHVALAEREDLRRRMRRRDDAKFIDLTPMSRTVSDGR